VESRCDAVVEVQPIRCRPFRLSVPHWLDCSFRFQNPLIEPDVRICCIKCCPEHLKQCGEIKDVAKWF
jgi:hypothetical protein